ncbi:MAG: hypothetical protein EZS28_013344 [Streblomastix strix]|uniref:Integrase catalytic domain-containing protein n=1 Tax=Streblomastix strix TaxID=222440 RepID=A0A5J4W8F3_9EUKA|nr:MAG: hypothetical protein EZS28_013344 [Streblomastix strix]
MANTFLTDKWISENCFIIELEKKRCSCSAPLQVAYFTMDNAMYFYLNTYYNFLTICLDMNYVHVIYGDIDSLCLAVAHESWPIKDKKQWDQLYYQQFPSASDDNYYDKKKILGWNIESESTTCLALAPKQHFKKLHGKSPDKIQDIPPDYQIKPLSKLNRPYFSPKLGSQEIDLVFSMDERIIRANQIYLFCTNINTKYLVVFPLRDKSAGQIKNTLQILVKNYNVTNIRGDGEKGINESILKSFCQENKITSFFTDSKFTNHNRVIDSVIREIHNAFGDDSQKFADNDLIIVIPNKDELAWIHKTIDQQDEKVIKIQELLSINDQDQNQMTTIQTNQIRVHKSKHASVVKKELSEEDKARLQAIDEAITNGFRKAVDLNIDDEEPQREIQTEQSRKHKYNINKHKEVPRETAQVEPEQVVKDIYLSHPNIEIQKFIIDTIWRCVDSQMKGEDFIFNSDNYIKLWALITQEEEKDIEVVMEEPLMRYNSCTSKKIQEERDYKSR